MSILGARQTGIGRRLGGNPSHGAALRRRSAFGAAAGLALWGGAARAACVGDLDGNHQVDLADLSITLSNYGLTGGATHGQGDLDGDHDVDLNDVSLLLAHYGDTCPVEICNNGIDDDGDGLTDCTDAADCPTGTPCGGNEFCSQFAECGCPANWGDCDNNPANGCETQLNTISHCGGCNAPCSLPNASESCATGDCVITSCNSSWCDVDGIASNGCEFHANSSPACAPLNMGSIPGDLGAGQLTLTGRGETWYRATLREDNAGGTVNVTGRIDLTPAAGTDYDLYMYCEACGGASAGSSTLSGTQTDTVTVRQNDSLFADNTFDVVIEVRWFSGCGTYFLTVTGNVGASVQTCAQ